MFSRKLAVAAVGFPALLGAQGSPEARNTRQGLQAAVITATRVAVTTMAPTATTTVIRGEDLRTAGISRLSDALRLIPGATVLSSGPIGSQTSLFLRGGNSNYVRVLIDGVPVNDAGGSIDLANISVANIDRIEVVRGPASVLYGSEAVTGVVQLFTRDGGRTPSLRALAGGGSEGAQRLEAGVGGGRARSRYSIDASRFATNGILPFNNDYSSEALSGALSLAPNAATDLHITARWSAGRYRYPTDFAGEVNDHNAEQVDHRLVTSLDAGRKWTPKVESRLSLTSNEFLPRTNDGPDTPGDTLGFYGYFSRSVRTRRAADLRFNFAAAPRQVVTLGAELAGDRERSSSRSLSQFGSSDETFEAFRRNTGLYAQAIGDLSERWSYVVGARVDDNSAFGTFTTGRANLALVVSGTTKVRGAFGTAFKAPSFFENFATGFVSGNPALKPEQTQSTELALDTFLDEGRIALTVAVFAQKFRNIVQYADTPPTTGGSNYFNVAGAAADGAEVETRWSPDPDVTFGFNYSYTSTTVTKSGFDNSAGASYVRGEQLLRRPKHSFAGSVLRTFEGGASVTFLVTRVGQRDDRDFTQFPVKPVEMDPYTRIDAAATVPLRFRGASILIRADNLLNAKYEDVLRFRAPGRALFAGVQLQR